jgi:hypothetical protein
MSTPYVDMIEKLVEIRKNVRLYLSHLDAVAQGAEDDDGTIDHYLDRLRELTDD